MPSFPLPPPPQETYVPPFPGLGDFSPPPVAPTAPTVPLPPIEAPTLPPFGSPEPLAQAALGSPEPLAPPPPPPPIEQDQPATVPVKGSPFKIVTPIIIGLVIVGLIALVVTVVIPLFKPKTSVTTPSATPKTTPAKSTTPVTLTYYGLWEPAAVMRPVLDEFEKQNPNLKVDYQMQSHIDYRERLQTLLNQKNSPDVIRFHSTWIPMLISGLLPAPAGTVTPTEIQSNFYPAVADSVIVNNQVYAVATTMEGLALFANQDILDTAQATIPTDWLKLRDLAVKLTQRDPTTKQITRAGIALGTTNNVDHWPDIVSLLLLQAGVDMKKLDLKMAGDALSFYTWFSTTGQTWNATFPSSTQAFAAGKVALIFAPSWRALDVQALNPSLKWKIYPVPQLPESPVVNWANFWVEGVSKNSAHPEEAWKLVKFLASSQAQQLLFNAASNQRGFGQTPANKALAQTVVTNPIVGPYVQQAQTAKTFYTTSLTYDGDTGINSRLNKYLENAVNTLNQTSDTSRVIPTLQQGFNQVLSQYNLVTATPATP